MSEVPFTAENAKKCVCPQCPVVSRSVCSKERLRRKKPEEFPGVFCSSGKTQCTDFDFEQMCICGECSVWDEYGLLDRKPLGYFCRDGGVRE